MRPVSAEFNRIVRGSHNMCARARVVTGFPTGTNPTGTEIPILAGDVKLDANADIRGTVDLQTDGTNMWSRQPSGLLTPYGNELFVERGIVLGGGTREFVSQGYYRIYTVEQSDENDAPIRLAGRDRMSGIIDARLLAPVAFAAGTTIETVVETLVHEVYPSATVLFDFDAAATTLGVSQVAEEDRYAFLLDLVRARGKVMFWDYAGRLRIETAPNPATTVFDINAGLNGVLISLARKLDREGVYNAVVALGERPSEGSPVRGIARDLNPASPTYWNGSFGKVPRFHQSPMVVTQSQAETAASEMLARSIGLPYNVTLSAVPNPALEPLDPIRVTHEDGFENHVIESLTIPLVAEQPLTLTTREKTSMNIGVSAT